MIRSFAVVLLTLAVLPVLPETVLTNRAQRGYDFTVTPNEPRRWTFAHVQLRIGVAFKSCCLLSVLAVTICSDVAQYSHREVQLPFAVYPR
jgi:hypothetical protein